MNTNVKLIFGVLLGIGVVYFLFEFFEKKRIAILWIAILFMLITAIISYRKKNINPGDSKNDIKENRKNLE